MNRQELDSLIEREGDRYEFEYRGYNCVLLRNTLKVWLGYVGVTPVHPLYGYNYKDIIKVPQEILQAKVEISRMGLIDFMAFCLQKKKEDIPNDHIQISAALPVHGGLNYSESNLPIDESESDLVSKIWWFGFHCGHHSDLVPEHSFDLYNGKSSYKTKEFVIKELEHLVDRLIIFKFGRDEQTRKETEGN